MKTLEISPNFTIEDIHKIREKNYEITKDMTEQERRFSDGMVLVILYFGFSISLQKPT